MIQKHRTLPIRIQINEALLRRISQEHPKRERIETDLLRRYAGYRGEQSLDYYLDLLNSKKYLVFQDLRLPFRNGFLQIDCLILSLNFALILEVKNIAGTLLFDREFNQLIRKIHDKEEGFSDPITQAQRHQYLLTNWFQQQKLPLVPIEYLVIISNPSTIIKSKTDRNLMMNKVIHVENTLNKVLEFEKRYPNDRWSGKDLRKITKLLLKDHSPYSPSLINPYKIDQSEILTGIQCENCLTLGMERKSTSWICSECHYQSKNAHELAIRDYFLLVKSTITNTELRDFLHLPSRKIAHRILTNLNLPYTGDNKGRVYSPSKNFFD